MIESEDWLGSGARMTAKEGQTDNEPASAARRAPIGRAAQGVPNTALPFAREAEIKIAAYAKGDAEWAARLGESAQTIARQEGWTVVPIDAVKAALLECWMRERRIPQHPATAQPGGRIAGIDDPLPGREVAAPAHPSPSTPAPRRLVANEAAAFGGEAPRRRAPTGAGTERFRYSVAAGIALTVLLVGSVSIGLWEEPLLPPPAPLPPPPARDIQALPLVSVQPAITPPPAVPLQGDAPPPAPVAVVSPPATPEKPAPPAAIQPTVEPAAAARPPASTEQVLATQRLLARLGYRPGPADGLLGPRTRAAVRSFQEEAGLAADGEVTAGLLQRLQARAAAAGGPAAAADPKRTELGVPAEPSLGEAALRAASRWMGALYDSVKQPEAVAAHCRNLPDNWFFDEAKGGLAHCGQFVDASAVPAGTVRGKHDP